MLVDGRQGWCLLRPWVGTQQTSDPGCIRDVQFDHESVPITSLYRGPQDIPSRALKWGIGDQGLDLSSALEFPCVSLSHLLSLFASQFPLL